MRTGFDVEIIRGRHRGRLFRAAPPGSPRGRLAGAVCDPATGRTCLLVGRLHYKSDLIRAIPELSGRDRSPDAELALAAFEARDTRGLLQLEGEFSLVLSDPVRRCLFLLRDPLGSWPLYWVSTSDRVLAGTSLLDLARQLGCARLDRDHLGAFLMWPFAGSELHRPSTAFESFRRVMAGQLVRVGEEGTTRILHEHVWPVACESSPFDAAQASQGFLERFRAAVRERLEPGTTAAHLSGGMDSSSVVCLAREALMEQGQSGTLQALSLVYRLPSLAGETPYVQQVLDQGGPITPHFLDGDAFLAFDWFSSGIPEHDEPYGGLHQLAAETRLVTAAEATGATTILSGGGAEVVAEGTRNYLADLVRTGRWKTALEEGRKWARAEGSNPLEVLRRHAMIPLLPGCLRDGLGTLCRRGRSRWPWVGQSAIPPWIEPRFARDWGLWQKGREAVGRLFRAPYETSAGLFAAQGEVGEWSTWNLAGPSGLHTGRPFLDPRLIRYALGLPHELRLRPGVAKPLLQSAMKGILPETIRTRFWKGHFNDVYRLGLARRLGALESMIQRSDICDLGILDPGILRTAMHQVAAGLGQTSAGCRLNSTLALIAWFDHLAPALARRADEPSEVVGGVDELVPRRSEHVSCP